MAALKKLDARTLPVMLNRFTEACLEGIKIEMIEPGEPVKYLILLEPNPEDVVFGGRKYLLLFNAIRGDTMYPWGPPHITFLTPIFHTNVAQDSGSICLSTFYDSNNGWSPALSIGAVLESIKWLLMNPETGGSHLNGDATRLWRACEDKINLHTSDPGYLNDRRNAFKTYIEINDKLYSNKASVIRSYAKYFPELLDIQIPESIANTLPEESEQKNAKKLTKKQQATLLKKSNLTPEEEEFHTLLVETRDAIISKYQEKKNKAKITKAKSTDNIAEIKESETVPVLCSSKTSPVPSTSSSSALVSSDVVPPSTAVEPQKNNASEKEPPKTRSKKKNLWEKVVD